MGFSLELFFETLLKMTEEDPHMETLREFILGEQKYARECGQISKET